MYLHPNVKKIVINNRMRAYGKATITGPDKGMIRLNLKKGDLVNTIIHENLHLIDPDMSHERVYRESAKIEGKMSLPEMAGLLLETHEKSKYPSHTREIMHTRASKIVTSKLK